MRLHRSGIAAVLVLSSFTVSAQQDEARIAAARASIAEGNRQYVAGYRAGDAAMVADVYAPDGARLAGGGVAHRGRPAITAAIQRFFDRVGTVRVQLEMVDLWVAGDRAYETGIWRYEYTVDEEARSPGGRYVTVWREVTAGEWKIMGDVGVPGTADAVDRLPPPATVEPVGAGVIETPADEYGVVLSTDGTEMFFVHRVNRRGVEQIWQSRRQGDTWEAPQVAPFSGTYYDKEPFLSPDGERLFFASTRPAAQGAGDDAFDLWMTTRADDGWSEPVRLPPDVNSDFYDNYPSVAANGNLYFASARPGGQGYDLYVARWQYGQFLPAENLGGVINSESTEADPFIAPDESFIVFSSSRPGGYGSGDLYISVRGADGWGAPRNLGAVVNTDDYEYTPFVSNDGTLYFSRGWGEALRISWSCCADWRP